MRHILFFLVLLIGDAKSQCLEVGTVNHDPNQKTFWLEGETYNSCFPRPDGIEIWWIFNGKDGTHFIVEAEPTDTVTVDVHGEYSVSVRAKWLGLGSFTIIDVFCLVLPESITAVPQVLNTPEQETWSSGGCIYVTAGNFTIITLSNHWDPVEIVTDESMHCIQSPANFYYVVWHVPNYKVSGIYNINQ